MQIENEIEYAARKIISSNYQIGITQEELDDAVNRAKEALKTGSLDFSRVESLVLTQDGHTRHVYRYSDMLAPENVICQCLKQLLDKVFRIRYPNRNKMVKTLFNTLPAVVQMSAFTIVKFDFKNYFNSLSATYVYEKFLKNRLSFRKDADLIKKFVEETQYTYAGLSTSNAMAEIAASAFDCAVHQRFSQSGLIYYERYIDDSILVLNRNWESPKIQSILEQVLQEIFHDAQIKYGKPCKTSFNMKKFCCVSEKNLSQKHIKINYLGYEFDFSIQDLEKRKVELTYGITEEKRKKYCRRVGKLIKLYNDPASPDYRDVELLRQRLRAFTSRVVYVSKYSSGNVWKVKGFISNYSELRYFEDNKTLEKNTVDFLKNMVIREFQSQRNPIPYFLTMYTTSDREKRNAASGYDLYKNMKSNRTLLFVEGIGYDYDALQKLCQKVHIRPIDSNGIRKSYNELVKEYLIRMKVGF